MMAMLGTILERAVRDKVLASNPVRGIMADRHCGLHHTSGGQFGTVFLSQCGTISILGSTSGRMVLPLRVR
jgi:hypothetical protein